MLNHNQPIEEFELVSNSAVDKATTAVLDSKQKVRETANFPELATTANSVYFRSYSRKLPDGKRENWYQSTLRVAEYLKEVGKLTDEEFNLILDQQLQCKSLFSGRLNWVGGSAWRRKPQNVYGAYNCSSSTIRDIESFGLLMNLAMQGVGTGAVLEPKYIEQLPTVVNRLNVTIKSAIGTVPKSQRKDETSCHIDGNVIQIHVGDSRQGWVDSYTRMLKLATNPKLPRELAVHVYLGNVRDKGEDLKGFGGVANPIKLPELYGKIAVITNKAVGRQLTSVECCLLIDSAAVTIVAGNIRRSAGMRQFIQSDTDAATAKDNLWQQDENGNWRIDPDRDPLRMANHTRVFHKKPTLEEITQSVTKQYYSGEGAIQFAPEAIARANADLLDTQGKRKEFIKQYCEHESMGFAYLQRMARYKGEYIGIEEMEHRLSRYGLNPCGK